MNDQQRLRRIRLLAKEQGVIEVDFAKPPRKPRPVREETPEERRRKVPDRLRDLCLRYFDFPLQDFHLEILKAMFAGGRYIINLPTDHGKSTVSSFLFPILSLMNDPDETHLICGANIADSKRRVQAVQRELETNEALLRDYPWVGKPKERAGRVWTATHLNVEGRTVNKPNPSVVAVAIGSAEIKGRRGKLVMDDIEGVDARYSPTKRSQLYDFVKYEAIRCEERGHESERPLLMALGTPFDVDSIYYRLEAEDWTVIRYPVYRDGGLFPAEQVYDASGKEWNNPPREYLWPEPDLITKVERARRSMTRQQFSVAYLMDPTGGDSSVVSFAQLREMARAAQFQATLPQKFIALDPASGSTAKRADYAGVAVVEIGWEPRDELPHAILHEAHAFRQGLFEQVHLCAHLHEKHGCPVIYEGNSQQDGVYRDAFGHLHPEVPLLRHYTSAAMKFDTVMGLTVIKTMLTRDKFQVPESQLDSEGVQAFLTEVRDLGMSGGHDHLCAAVWFVVRRAYEQRQRWRAPEMVNTYSNGMAAGSRYLNGRPATALGSGYGFGSYVYRSPEERLLDQAYQEERARMQRYAETQAARRQE